MMEKLLPDPFLKIQIEHISGSIVFKKVLYSLFLLYNNMFKRNMFKLSCRPLVFTSYKAFLKNKERSGISFPGSFSA